jgi:hypothetical protein
MLTRVTLGGLLAVTALAALAGPAEAFGRRKSSSCSTPVYYHPCPPIHCPPCPPPQPIPCAWDCVINQTSETLRIHVTSGFGHAEAVVPPGCCFYFRFRTDNSNDRVVTAFTLNNVLVANFPFTVVAQSPPYNCEGCLPIFGTAAAPTKEAPKRGTTGKGGAAGAAAAACPCKTMVYNDPL